MEEILYESCDVSGRLQRCGVELALVVHSEWCVCVNRVRLSDIIVLEVELE